VADRVAEQLPAQPLLGEVVRRPRLHHVHGELLVALAGKEDDRDRRRSPPHRPQRGPAGHVGQVVVEQDAVERRRPTGRPAGRAPGRARTTGSTPAVLPGGGLHRGDRAGRVASLPDLRPHARLFQRAAHPPPIGLVVVYDQDAQAIVHADGAAGRTTEMPRAMPRPRPAPRAKEQRPGTRQGARVTKTRPSLARDWPHSGATLLVVVLEGAADPVQEHPPAAKLAAEYDRHPACHVNGQIPAPGPP
jgi:hypothetical protein